MIEKVRRNVANALWATKREREKSLSPLRLFATPWVVAYQAPTSMGFSRQEYWSGLPFPSPGIFPTQWSNLGIPHCRQMLYGLSHQGSSRPFRYDLNQTPYYYTVELRNRVKGLDLIECLKNYGWRFVMLYRRQRREVSPHWPVKSKGVDGLWP